MSRLSHLMVMPDGRLELVAPAPPRMSEVRIDPPAGIDRALVAANRARIEELKRPRPHTPVDDPWVSKLAWCMAGNTVMFVAVQSSYSPSTRRTLLALAVGLLLRACGCPVEAAMALARRWATRREPIHPARSAPAANGSFSGASGYRMTHDRAGSAHQSGTRSKRRTLATADRRARRPGWPRRQSAAGVRRRAYCRRE